jgi:hypothetical protein
MHVTALLRVSLAEREGFEPSVLVLARTTVQQSIGLFLWRVFNHLARSECFSVVPNVLHNHLN